MAIHQELGPLLSGDDYIRPSWEKRLELPPNIRRPRPSDMWGNPTDRSVRSVFLVRDLAETYPWYGSHNGAYWSIIEKGQRLQEPNADIDKARQRLLSQIKGQNVNLAQSIAEYRQVAPLFLDLSKSIVSAVRSLTRGRPLKAFRHLVSNTTRPGRVVRDKDIANRWLELQYGWGPLLGDIYGLTETLATKLSTGIPMYVTSSATATLYDEQRSSYNGPGGRVYTSVDRELITHTVKLSARYVIREPGVRRLSQMGFTNPAQLAWELVPYSFVFDWMIPVGDYLGQLDSLVGVEDLRVKMGGRVVRNASLYLGGGAKTGTSTYFSDRRYRSGSTASTVPAFKLRYEPSTSLVAIANGTALLSQLRKEVLK